MNWEVDQAVTMFLMPKKLRVSLTASAVGASFNSTHSVYPERPCCGWLLRGPQRWVWFPGSYCGRDMTGGLIPFLAARLVDPRLGYLRRILSFYSDHSLEPMFRVRQRVSITESTASKLVSCFDAFVFATSVVAKAHKFGSCEFGQF